MRYSDDAIDLAKHAGRLMLASFHGVMQTDWKDDNTPLTKTDTAINDLVLATIKGKYPLHCVLGEEGSELTDSDYVWVLDPIDGTIPFSHGLPLFVFSLALTYKGESILGVIYDPFLDRLFYAEKGHGTTLNGEPVHVSTNKSVSQTLIEVESWKGYKQNINPLRDELIIKGAQVTTICSVVYAGMLVACGYYGAVLFSGTKPWDAASVKIIVEEAGGRVTDIDGNDQRYDRSINGLIATNGHLHDELLNLIREK